MPIHLTAVERDSIAHLRHEGANQQEIARAIGRSPSTISRELRRNRTGGEYYAAQAQRQSERRRRERPLVRKMHDPQINQVVREGLGPRAIVLVGLMGAGKSSIGKRLAQRLGLPLDRKSVV